MKFSAFFVNRPIFASALSIVIFLAGLLAMFQLPISEYPEVSPPSVVVSASFPGANPKVISETVAAPLEEQRSFFEPTLGAAVGPLCDAIDASPNTGYYKAVSRLARAFVEVEHAAMDMQ